MLGIKMVEWSVLAAIVKSKEGQNKEVLQTQPFNQLR
jgi:hypothetical protein